MYICKRNNKINNMEKEFIPYELALKLKELGFNELCFGYCNSFYKKDLIKEGIKGCVNLALDENEVALPLWQQAFDWFREQHNFDSWIYKYYDEEVEQELYRFNLILGDFYSSFYNTYQEARQACLEKLIEIVENENRTH